VLLSEENMTATGTVYVDEFIKEFIVGPKPDEPNEFTDLLRNEVNLLTSQYKDIFKTERDIDFIICVHPAQNFDMTGVDLPIEMGQAERKYSDYFQGQSWINSRASRKKLHYIASSPENMYVIYIAARKVLFEHYGITLKRDTPYYSKIDETKLSRIQADLAKQNYYSKCCQLIPGHMILKPEQELEFAGIIKDEWSVFQGVGGYRVSDVSQLYSFLGQFFSLGINEDEKKLLLGGVISMLKHIKIISRGEVVSHFKKLFNNLLNNEGVSSDDLMVCKLGNSQDSGSLISYCINDINSIFGKHFYVEDNLSVLLGKSKQQTILLNDDASYSTTQIVSIFQELLGEKDRATKEHHVEPLSEAVQKRFLESKIILSFMYFYEPRKAELEKTLQGMGFHDLEIRNTFNFSPGVFDESGENIFRSAEERDCVRKHLTAIGEKLLYSRKRGPTGEFNENWDDERIKRSALGFNDAQQLIVFDHNVPSYTLTPLWLDGEVDGHTWKALFPRLSK